MEPVTPPRSMDDGGLRATVTLWPILTYLLIFAGLLGFVTWLVLFLIFNLNGLPGVLQGLTLLAGAAAAAGLWLRNSIQFTADDLVVTVFFRPRRVPWSRVQNVSLVDVSDDDTGRLTGRRLTVRYRRDAEPPSDPMPTVFGAYRVWARRRYRTLSLPVQFPPSPDEFGYVPREPRTWVGRNASRQRDIIRAEFADRGYALPD